MIEYVSRQWFNLCERLPLNPKGNISPKIILEQEIIPHYLEKHRYYHNLSHIAHGLHELEEIISTLSHPNEFKFAWFFHDYVYSTIRSDNEKRSSQQAAKFASKLGLSSSFSKTISPLIIVTDSKTKPSNYDETVICDIDYAILGSSPLNFAQYLNNIDLEYKWVHPKSIYFNKRKNFFERTEKKERIFYTDYFYNKYESIARENISEVINNLQIKLNQS